MALSRRDYLIVVLVIAGVGIGQYVIENGIPTFQGGQKPDAKAVMDFEVSPQGYAFRSVSFENAGRVNYTLNVDKGEVRTWLSRPTSEGNMKSFASNVGCEADGSSGLNATATCRLKPGKFQVVVQSVSNETAQASVTVELYENGT